MKRLISLVLTLVMLLGMAPAVAWFTADAADSGEFTIVQPKPAELSASDSGTLGAWYINGSTFVTTEGSANYIEIVEDGCDDVGALHVYQDNVANNDMSVGTFIGGQAAGTYTLKLNVKGDLGLLGQTCKFYPYGCDGLVENLHDKLGTTDVADWTEVSYEITAASDFYYLIFSFSKYNWQTDMYVDNIQLINASGVNVLSEAAGNFYTQETVTTDSATLGQWPDSSLLDTSIVSSAYEAHAGVWTPMYPEGAPNESSWNAWNDAHYGEIVADGYKDAGSLHLISVASSNTGVAIDAGMVSGQTYTLGFWAKGTVNTGKVMGMYANGDGTIIGTTSEFKDGWNYYEHTFTASQSGLNLVAADWGSVDIYLDNITLKGADGVDLLAGCGDFYTSVDPSLTAVPVVLDTTKLDDSYDAPSGEWVPFTPYVEYKETWPAWASGVNYGEIVAEGNKDVGALHLVSAGSKNTGVVINPGMVSGESYTVGMWVKGSASSNKMLAIYSHGDPCLIGNPEYCGEVCLEAVPADWTYIEKTFTANRNSLAIFAADWGVTDIYIDNITLKNSAGTDLLAGYGDFYTYADLSKEVISFDASAAASAYICANGQWVPMYPTGAPDAGTWGAWSADSHYAEMVEEGHNDLGALHMVSASGKNVGVAFNAGMTVGETYTLGLWAKGTSNSGSVMISYGNGDFTIINTAQDLGADWTYYEVSFTATMSQINFCVRDWGVSDVYIDNVTLKNSAGTDLLSGYGDFWQEVSEEEPEPDAPTEPKVEGLGVISSSLERAFRWYWNGMTYVQTDYSTVNISSYGDKDPGSLHIWQSTTGSSDVNLCLVTTMASDLSSGSYTLSMNVKGTFCNTEGFYVYPAYCNDTQLADLNVGKKLLAVSGAAADANGMYTVDEWTNLTWTLPANPEDGENGFMYLALSFSKYNNACEYYVDNIQVLDPNGNDVLGGAGSFMDSGSEAWPIVLPATGGSILNSNTLYYMSYVDSGSVTVENHVESGIVTGDQNFSVTAYGKTVSASSKTASVNVAPAKDGMPVVFSVTSNEGSLDIPSSTLEMMQRAGEFNIYDVSFSGAVSGTEALTLGQQTLGFVAGDADGYSYTYTAAVKGTLTVTVESGNVNVTLSTADSSASDSLDMDAGETVTVKIVPTKTDVGYVATDAVINSSFAEYVCTHSYESVVTPPSLSSQGYTTHTCAECGDSYKDSYTDALTDVEGWSLTLGGDLSVNFKISVADEIVSSARIVVSVAGSDYSYNAADVRSADDGYCYVSANVAAAQMNEIITVKVVNGEDSSTAKEYTVLQYANAILADESMSTYHALVKEMLCYGAAAQVYFDYDAENLVNAGIEGAGATAVPETADQELSIEGESENIYFYGASLVFENKIAVRYYFAVSDDIANHSFTVNGESYAAVQKGDYYYIEVEGINPQDLDDSITVIADGALSVTYSPMNYIVRMAQKGSENLQALVKAMYNYHLAAEVLCPDAA